MAIKGSKNIMDKFTFGDSKAAVNLMKTLNAPFYSLYARKVCRLLAKQLQSIKAIMAIPDQTIRKAVLKLWHDRFIAIVNNSEMPEVIKTHTLCVATTFYRVGIHGK